MDMLHLPDLLDQLSDIISILSAGTWLAVRLYARIRHTKRRQGPGRPE